MRDNGITSDEDILRLSKMYESEGINKDVGNGKSPDKAANWTKHETARLCHVLADRRHATILAKLYHKSDRQELDVGSHDPWSEEFADLFNSTSYQPYQPEGESGVTDDILLDFDPTRHPVHRTGRLLKSKWTSLRSKYTIAKQKFDQSGQGESDVFPSFVDGNDSLCYLHCVFFNKPSLDMIARALPDHAQTEAGLPTELEGKRALNGKEERTPKQKEA